jgi:Domain of Unknown Function (DUF1206)
VEKVARVGLIAQGVSFGLVAVLAIQLALGMGGEATDRQGALRKIAQDGFGRVVVILLAVGFAAYVVWRLTEVVLGHEVEERHAEAKWSKRAVALGKGTIYGALCAIAVSILLGEGAGGDEEKEAAEDILGWPAGRWIIGAIAAAFALAALWNVYRAVSGKYKESLKTWQLSREELRWTTRIAFAGLISRAVVFAFIAWFFFRASAEYDAREAQGLDGALRTLAHEPFGPWLLGLVAAGLFAWGVFCLIQARYREV